MRSTLQQRRLWAAALAALAIAGCSTPGAAGPGRTGSSGNGGGATGATASGASSGAGSTQLAAALLPVTPVSTGAGAATGLLDPGSPLVLDATGPDGATFHAEFPAGAATVPVTVTMQPLQGLGGLSGAVEAVDFEPSGLLLVKPAVLTIDGPVANAVSARAFGYQDTETGSLARPVITASAAGPLRLVISHFSGYGATADDPPAWTITTITATEANDIIELEDFVLANAYRARRNGSLSESEADRIIGNALDAIGEAGKRLGDTAVATANQGNVSAAAQTQLDAAVTAILAAARADELLGRPPNEAALAVARKILDAYLEAVTKTCTTAHDLSVLGVLVSMARQAQLLGSATAGNEVASCTSARVQFVTTVTASLAPGPIDTPATYTGSVKIDVSAPIDLFNGQPSADVAYSAPSTITFKDDTCTVSQTIDDGTFTVLRALLVQSTKPSPAPAASPAKGFVPMPLLAFSDASVRLSLGTPAVRNTESGSCGPDDGFQVYLTTWFDQLHPAEKLGNGAYSFEGGFEIPGDGTDVLARRTIDRSIKYDGQGPNVYTSHTVIEIVHTP